MGFYRLRFGTHDVVAVRNRRVYLLMIAIAVLVGVLAVIVEPEPEREPEYGGRKLSEWVLKLPGNASPHGNSAAEEAIRHVGTNSLPYLLKWITYEPRPWRLKLYETLGKLFRKDPNALFQDKRMLLAAGAAQAFGALGAKAEPAMSEVGRMAHEGKGGLPTAYAAFAFYSHNQLSANLVPNMTISVFRGVDTFSLSYLTTGVPVLTVSHTNARPALPPRTPRSPGR